MTAQHLRLDAFRAVVYEDESYDGWDEAAAHHESCTLCQKRVAAERERNPLVAMAKASEDKEAFWESVDEAKEAAWK